MVVKWPSESGPNHRRPKRAFIVHEAPHLRPINVQARTSGDTCFNQRSVHFSDPMLAVLKRARVRVRDVIVCHGVPDVPVPVSNQLFISKPHGGTVGHSSLSKSGAVISISIKQT